MIRTRQIKFGQENVKKRNSSLEILKGKKGQHLFRNNITLSPPKFYSWVHIQRTIHIDNDDLEYMMCQNG